MEHVVDSFMTRTFSVRSEDPYRLSHDMLHWCQQFGRVEEHRNRVLSSGPRITSEVELTLKKHLDKFSSIVLKIRLEGHITLKRLDVTIAVSFRADLPAPHGLLTSTFDDYYTRRIFHVLYGTAKKLAEDIVASIEKRAAASQPTISAV